MLLRNRPAHATRRRSPEEIRAESTSNASGGPISDASTRSASSGELQNHLEPGAAMRGRPPRRRQSTASKAAPAFKPAPPPSQKPKRAFEEVRQAVKKRLFKRKSVYSCLTIMKRFTLVLVISIGLLPGLVCKAGDGSVTETRSPSFRTVG